MPNRKILNMNTITLTPEAYNAALLSASKVKTTVEDWVNKILLDISVDNSAFEKKYKQPTKLEMYSWDEMEGMFSSGKSDKELLDEYFQEKYGV